MFRLVIISIILFSCESNSNIDESPKAKIELGSNQSSSLEEEVISDTFFDLFDMPELSWRYFLYGYPEGATEQEIDSIERSKKREFSKLLSNTDWTICLDSVLLNECSLDNELVSAKDNPLLDHFKSKLEKLQPKSFDTKQINKSDTISFECIESKRTDSKRSYLLGYAQFSRIIFSKDQTQCYFLFYQDCGSGLCGSLTFVYSEQVDKKWKIVLREILWLT
jgi:hypothetical protein